MTYVDWKPTLDALLAPLFARVRKLENTGWQPPTVNADPAVLTDGMIWYRQDLGQLRCRAAGVTRIVTLT